MSQNDILTSIETYENKNKKILSESNRKIFPTKKSKIKSHYRGSFGLTKMIKKRLCLRPEIQQTDKSTKPLPVIETIFFFRGLSPIFFQYKMLLGSKTYISFEPLETQSGQKSYNDVPLLSTTQDHKILDTYEQFLHKSTKEIFWVYLCRLIASPGREIFSTSTLLWKIRKTTKVGDIETGNIFLLFELLMI